MRIIIYTAVFLLVLLQSMILTEIHKLNSIEIVIPEYTKHNHVLGISIKLAEAVKTVESRGNYHAKGASGEYGAYQMMPTTYKSLSKKCLGEVVPATPENQDKIVVCTFQQFLKEDRKPKEIIQWWNSGSFTRCSKGVNKFNVKYDCPAYVQKVLAHVK